MLTEIVCSCFNLTNNKNATNFSKCIFLSEEGRKVYLTCKRSLIFEEYDSTSRNGFKIVSVEYSNHFLNPGKPIITENCNALH